MLRLGGGVDRQPIVLTEFGGIALRDDDGRTWGYSVCRTPEELLERYTALMEAVRPLPSLAGFCYTQFADTFQESNGLLTDERIPKVPLEKIEAAVRGDAPLLPAL